MMWSDKLTQWFDAGHRSMPWRDEPTPYHVLVSEFMLQQTQVATVIPYFNRFMQVFPTLETLARADIDAVLKMWEGLGYYSRARRLHACAAAIVQGGKFPETAEELERLPGIGPYTAAAVASIAFGHAYPVVDGNVLRIRARMTEDSSPMDGAGTRRRVYESLREVILQADGASRFNQAMMELGAMVCHPRCPQCMACPVRDDCLAALHGTQEAYPRVFRKEPIPHYHVAVALIFDAGRLLILRRSEEQMLGGLWEFPGGKLEAGETACQAAVREVREETGLAVTVIREITVVRHAYSHFRITMHAFECALSPDTGALASARPHHWILPGQIADFTFPKANHKIFDALGWA